MTQFTATVMIIVDEKDEVRYVGDIGEDTAWRICLGWPTSGEIEEYKRAGWYEAKATLTWGRL